MDGSSSPKRTAIMVTERFLSITGLAAVVVCQVVTETKSGLNKHLKVGCNWPLFETAHGGARDRNWGWDVYWPWVILNELHPGGPENQKRGFNNYIGKDRLGPSSCLCSNLLSSDNLSSLRRGRVMLFIRHSLPSLIFSILSTGLSLYWTVHTGHIYAIDSVPSLNCRHFCTTRPPWPISLWVVSRSIHNPTSIV